MDLDWLRLVTSEALVVHGRASHLLEFLSG